MWDEVVGEHRQPAQVCERRHSGALQVRGGDLGTFEKRDLELLISGAVSETGPPAEPPRERHRRAVRGVNEGAERSSMVALDSGSEIGQRACVEAHQLVAGGLAQRLRDGRGVKARQLGRAPRAVRSGVVAQRGGDRAVARQTVAFTERRKPARAEVDRIEGQPEGGQLLAVGQPRLLVVVVRRGAVGQLQRRRVGGDRVGLQRDAARPLGDRCADTTELVHGAQDDAPRPRLDAPRRPLTWAVTDDRADKRPRGTARGAQ